jgi:hypothetical protein
LVNYHSAINQYSTCARKYDYHYNKKLRSKVVSGALLFGSAIDLALNHLLLTRNLEESYSVFEKAWRFQEINRVGENLQNSTNVVYAKKDWDANLVLNQPTKWSPTGKARGSQETPIRGEHPVPEDQFTHG